MTARKTFEAQGDRFVLDGEPVRILSGAIHYFRTVPEYWEDRLLKLRALGLNTVETYVPWNLHEPRPGEFDFAGIADVAAFVRLAGSLGLHVIVRPSPYICAEWEFGGLPAWLLAEPGIRLRCYNEPYLRRIDAYYDRLLPMLRPLLCTNGGPIIALQIENEYGSYGNDTAYLAYLRDAMRARGMDVLLFTSDGEADFMLQGGMVPEALATVNFGSRSEEAFKQLRRYQPVGPLMVMEFWNGWFDHWGEKHHVRDADNLAQELDAILRQGASLNFYMFHGGTNFGFWSGANHGGAYAPTVTSYDYDALLSESGRPTVKYEAVRRVLSEHMTLPDDPLPARIPSRDYGELILAERASLFGSLDALSAPMKRTTPEPMENVGQSSGFILYSTHVTGPRPDNELVIQEVRDRALVFVDGRCLGVVERADSGRTHPPIRFDIPPEGVRLDILVENMGRINYGPLMRDPKGVTEGIRLGNQFLYHWELRALPLDDLSGLVFAPGTQAAPESGGRANSAFEAPEGDPAFYCGKLKVEEPADTFLELDGWTKGVVFVNGFNLGRYWSLGPQRRLYVPGPLLRKGENEIVVFELHGVNRPTVRFADEPDVGAGG
ncbi:beta-galactosidase [Cohnella sp. OV330]|uniref:glycoside hydrolase family 35 protein n=1 Tax=Cohnella sp. OV330 TaxID=1855288 RepID=UPI0008E0DF29|nr:beta-galactosidase family protein [Cohnella sp. OV330]SFB56481.1 beta-galactosidase [Cohnella sp. OV330]